MDCQRSTELLLKEAHKSYAKILSPNKYKRLIQKSDFICNQNKIQFCL